MTSFTLVEPFSVNEIRVRNYKAREEISIEERRILYLILFKNRQTRTYTMPRASKVLWPGQL